MLRPVVIAWAMLLSFAVGVCSAEAADVWPELPAANAAVELPAQVWPHRPGERRVRVLVHYPGGKLSGVTAKTGIMLTLHNWGGVDCIGTAAPQTLAEKLNVVALCVNYLQSGKESVEGPEPYDFGYLQALDALRAMWWVKSQLEAKKIAFADGRMFATGGSGGGNVTLMAHKLAPRTFACVVDLCGMKKLSHDIAFNLPGGSDLDARYSRDPSNPYFLSQDEQDLRYLGHPGHLAVMKKLGTRARIVTVHGADDVTCPTADAREFVRNVEQAGLAMDPHFITKQDLDGKVFTSSGHSLGNRTAIVFKVAGKYLIPDGPEAMSRAGKSDFDLRDEVRYPTPAGEFVISYKPGYPVGEFVAAPSRKIYKDHHDLTAYLDDENKPQPVKTADGWQIRRGHILENLHAVMGRFPGESFRVPLDVKVLEEVVDKGRDDGKGTRGIDLVRRKISFQSDPFDRVTAWLLIPADVVADSKSGSKSKGPKRAAILCLHQTTPRGKDEPIGLAGSPNMHYGRELAERGYIVLAPDYPGFGEHKYDFAKNPEYAGGTIKAIWDNRRAVDFLTTLPEVDAERIGVIGHSLGGHNSMFTAAFEPRLKAIVSSCGFSSMRKDDVPSWTGKTYMPRIASEFQNDVNKLPFDFPEIIGCFAPRAFLACAATRDSDFDVSGVKDCLAAAAPIFRLLGSADNLHGEYPEAPHDFPPATRKAAYEFLDKHLQHTRAK